MKKSDLQEFDIVVLRDGNIYILLRNEFARKTGLGLFGPDNDCGCEAYLDSYDNDLKLVGNNSRDIMRVCKLREYSLAYRLQQFYLNKNIWPCDYDWKRQEVEEMTLEEVCKALGKDIKIVKK